MSVETQPDREAILVALATGPMSLDDLSAATKIAYRDLNRNVLELRLAGDVAHEVAKVKGKGKVNLYSLKLKGGQR